MHLVLLMFIHVFWPREAVASSGHGEVQEFTHLAAIAIFLAAAAVAYAAEKYRQSLVVGFLLIGIVLGNIGFDFLNALKEDPFIGMLAQLGVLVLLFQVGLESSLAKMLQVGARAFVVAAIGVAVPFVLGWKVLPFIIPGYSPLAYALIGAMMTATSVSIPATILRECGKLNTFIGQTILGGAVIDDVKGLIILAVMVGILETGSMDYSHTAWLTFVSFSFLAGSLVLGVYLAPPLSALFSHVSSSHGMKMITALIFMIGFALMSLQVGLASIVGAFAAGLILDGVHFRGFRDPDMVTEFGSAMEKLFNGNPPPEIHGTLERAREKHVEDLIASLGYLLNPIFFILTGMKVDLWAIADPNALMLALAISFFAIIGKLASGIAGGPGIINKLLVGVGMVPRGEVGLIFAQIGLERGALPPEVYAAGVGMVLLSTLFMPPVFGFLLKLRA